MAAIDRELFRRTLLGELRSAWQTLRNAHAAEQFYSFGLYTAPLAEYLMVTASTEEGLTTATDRYVARKGCDPGLMRTCLRFSPGDSPLHAAEESLLAESDRLRTAGPDPYEDTPEAQAAVALVFEVALETLQQLDREQVFGTGLERDRLVLGIWMGDQPDEDRVEFARQLNPAAIADRFERELEQGYQAFLELSRRESL